ncbi:MAG: hypothetical protein HRT87_11700 [Legionellales bacterium]|nr:hypothetical protein [Legionellales bacterium]
MSENLIEINGLNILILALFVYFVGSYISDRIKILDRFHIPVGVIGGIPASIIFSIIERTMGCTFVFGTNLRDFFLLFFFCTTGMLANLPELLKGGRLLVKLILAILVFLIMQNLIGILGAKILGVNLINGLIVGSITLAGGHGTAISWGSHLSNLGYTDALDVGLISATLGLISGALIGGGVSKILINRIPSKKNLKQNSNPYDSDPSNNLLKFVSSTPLFLKTILIILLIMLVGKEFNKILAYGNIISPDYLPTMIFAILFVTVGNRYSQNFIDNQKMTLLNNASLQIFIAMTMMSIDAKYLVHDRMQVVLFILLLQVIFIIIYAKFVFFRVGGKNYDAAALTSGFIGCGLGATPVGLANIETITNKYGPSLKAFFLLPLLGSVFTDSVNAIIINCFLYLLT